MVEVANSEFQAAQDETNGDVFERPIEGGETVFEWADDGSLVWVETVKIMEDGSVEVRITDDKTAEERTFSRSDLMKKVETGHLIRSV